MLARQISSHVRKQPFRAFEIQLENGERLVVRHPEAMAVSKWIVVVITSDGEVVDFRPSAVTAIRQLGRRNGR